MRRIFCCLALHLQIVLSPTLVAQIAPSPADIPELNTSDRIDLQQIDQLIASERWSEAVDEIMRTIDSGSDRLIQVKLDESKEDLFERWFPISSYLQDRLLRWGQVHPQLLQIYRRRTDASAKHAMEDARAAKDLAQAIQVSRDFFASSFGDDALLLVADLAIEAGKINLARNAIQRIDSRLTASGVGQATVAMVPSVSWNNLLSRLPDQSTAIAKRLQGLTTGFAFGCYSGSDLDLRDVAMRLPYCSAIDGDRERYRLELDFAAKLFAGKGKKFEAIQSIRLRDSRSAGRIEPALLWVADLPRILRDAAVHENEVSVGEVSGKQASYFPEVIDGLLLVHLGNKIIGFDIQTGVRWPIDGQDTAVFDSGQAFRELLPTEGLPISAWPRFTLNSDSRRVAARLGPPVTGWLPVVRKPPSSASQIAVLDIQEEGRLLDAYPLAIKSADLENYEFEGSPLLIVDSLVCGITRRQGAQFTSRVICFDLQTGKRLWLSPVLASGTMLMDRSAHRVSHCQVTHRDGALYYHANLGSVSSIELGSGKLNWLVRYPRGEDSVSPFPRMRSAKHRDLAPVLLSDEMAFVAAADCDRLFALDSSSGQLLWTSGAGQGSDAIYMLGTTGDHLIASGDRVYWIDKHSGSFDAAFPGGASPIRTGAAVRPQAAGRGAIVGSRIYWPTASEVLVFDSTLGTAGDRLAPRLVERIDLQSLGLHGGNLLAHDRWLILASSEHLAVFGDRETITKK